MEQVLTNGSRIPARITFLKPISSAIAIGTGGPFGAEGPIIATGGALGSLVGQFMHTTPAERKILLAVGAAAGMAATFGSPVSAVLLAIELLLFEFRARSIVPVALGSAAAAGMRVILDGAHPVFPMPDVAAPQLGALAFYVLLGAVIGVAAAAVTRAVYAIEDAFERLPIHWMWWPAIGAVAVGVVGYFAPTNAGRRIRQYFIDNLRSLDDAVCRHPVLDEICFLVNRIGEWDFRRHVGSTVHDRRRVGVRFGSAAVSRCCRPRQLISESRDWSEWQPCSQEPRGHY